MTNTLAMDTLLTTADHAARQSDRWLFVALLIIFLVFLALLVRTLNTRLTAITDRHITQTENMSQVVANNTAALNEVSRRLDFCKYNAMQQRPPPS